MSSPEEHRARAQAALRSFVAQHGRVPATKEWDALSDRPSRPTIARLFGGWAEFVRSVGLEPLRERKPTSDVDLDEVVDHLRTRRDTSIHCAEDRPNAGRPARPR